MRIKQRLEDFRVRELLRPDYLAAAGEWRVYRVTKKKLTSLEAAARLAREAGVPAGDVTMAGFKDRQGITVQHMALHRGRDVLVAERDLRIESIGFADRELSSQESSGNAFEVVVRGLDRTDLTTLRENLTTVREQGVIDYFDEQRFGNLRHGQGWVALELLRGRPEQALKQLIATPSVADDPKTKAFRTALTHAWGKWAECRDIAGRFGQHHSVFEHLKKHPDDFAGAFYHVASRVRLIHLYAYQSHLWNRAVANLVRARTERAERRVVDSEEGPLLYPLQRSTLADLGESFRLPGPRLEDVTHPEQRRALEEVLARDKVAAADFDIRGISGFQLKGEDRPLWVVPGHLRVRPAEPDHENPPFSLVKLRFELPRGAYATLVVRRLLARPLSGRDAAEGELGAIPPLEVGPAPRERDDFGRGYGNRGRRPRREPGERPFRGRSDPRGTERPPGEWSRGERPRGERHERRGERGRDERGPRGGSYRPRQGEQQGGGERSRRGPGPEGRALERRDERERGPRGREPRPFGGGGARGGSKRPFGGGGGSGRRGFGGGRGPRSR